MPPSLVRTPVIDEIVRVSAGHYAFTDENLDFIPSTMLRIGINYDIKSRLGQDGVDESE